MTFIMKFICQNSMEHASDMERNPTNPTNAMKYIKGKMKQDKSQIHWKLQQVWQNKQTYSQTSLKEDKIPVRVL